MKSIDGRLNNLEHRFGIAKNKPRYVLILDGATGKRALSDDNCVQILDEAGYLHAGGFGVVDLTQIPSGLNAIETEKFVRENGAMICSACRVGGPSMNSDAGSSLRSVPAEFKVELDRWKERLAAERPDNENVR
jgi:hypothetical protein